jgi:chromosomal replication initiator protein
VISGLFSLPMPDVVAPLAPAGSFVVGPENGIVRELAQAVASEPLLYNPLVLYGPPSVGKSTLAHLLADRRRTARALAHGLETTGADLARQLAHAAETNSVPELRTRHHRCDWLLIDNLDELAGKPAAQEFLINTLDVLVRRGVLVIATLRKLPQSTAELSPGLASRLNAGLIVPLAPPAELARREIVRQLAERLDLRLSSDLVEQLAAARGLRAASLTVPRLRSRLLQLASASQHAAKPMGPAAVATVLSDDEADTKAVVRQIMIVVARHFGLTMTQLRGKSRQQTTAEARSLAMYLCRELTDLTLAEIGRQFGNRDHTTVLHACRKVAALVAGDPATGRLVQELSTQFD